MGGGLMQLVAYGAQDVYLTGNPSITFFKVVYRRHTNFATESLEQTFAGTGDFSRKVTCELQRAGDLVTKMYLRAVLPALDAGAGNRCAWVSRPGHALIKEAELDIGGVKVDKHYGDWLNVWYELARNFAHDRGYGKMIGNTPALTTLTQTHEEAVLWIPLKFSCCTNDGLALPVIALQYHDIRINIEFNSLNKMLVQTRGSSMNLTNIHLGNVSLFVDYVYLENDERKRFAQANHEYLFEQLQFTGDESITNQNAKFRLNLNHPVKELIWVARHQDYTTGQAFLSYNPTNADLARVEATKRFVLRCANYTVGNDLILGANNLVNPNPALPAGLLTIYNEIRCASLSVIPDIDNLTILGRLLSVVEFSTTITALFGAFGNGLAPVISDGHQNQDVLVYQWDNYGVWLDGTRNPTEHALLQLNGHDRFTKREGLYFNVVQPYQCHSNTPADGVNVFSFALNPEEHQPSGTCNMSRIDNATLNIDFHTNFRNSNSVISIYARNYNVLRVMSGMGGLAYSN